MKKGIHKDSKEVKFTCACGEIFTALSTAKETEINVEVCSKCHPIYTGKKGTTKITGTVDKFNKKYGMN